LRRCDVQSIQTGNLLERAERALRALTKGMAEKAEYGDHTVKVSVILMTPEIFNEVLDTHEALKAAIRTTH
jgi:hypothetical protein